MHHNPLPEAMWISLLGGTTNTRADSCADAAPGKIMLPRLRVSQSERFIRGGSTQPVESNHPQST